MKKLFITLLLFQFAYQVIYSQNVGIGTSTPNASAQLEVSSTTKGLLPPRMTQAQRDAIASPASGLLIFNTNTNSFQYYNGVSWSNITHSGIASGTNNQVAKFLGPWGLQSSMITDNGTGVGIGTTAPGEKLHVAGNIKGDTVKPNAIKLTPNAGNGKILTSDATGNASWQTSSTSAGGNIGFGVWGDCATNGNISEYNPVTDSTGGFSDQFGFSVSISGNYAIVGAPYDDVGANVNQGSASIYQYNGTNWVLMQKITDATGAAVDEFGFSVSISGNYAIVGAVNDDVGANNDQGSASIYQYNGSSWVLMQKITDATGAVDDRFGSSVSISGNYAIVGAESDDVGANANQGSANIYQRIGLVWRKLQYVTDPAGAVGESFGSSVAIDETNRRFIIGAPTAFGNFGLVVFGKIN